MAYEDTAKDLAKKAPAKKAPPADDGDDASETDSEEMDSYDSVEDSAADELASLAGVKDVEAFKTALSDYVKACVRRAMDEQ